MRITKILALAVLLCFYAPVAHAQCANPVGAAGDMTYNDNEEVVQWCDGTNWNGVNTAPYIPNGVYFDEVNDYLTSNGTLTGVVDSKSWTGSFWFQSSSTDAEWFLATDDGGTGGDIRILRVGDNIEVYYDNPAGVFLGRIRSNGSYFDGNWHHVLFSIDIENGTGSMYVDDNLSVSLYTHTDDFMDFTPDGAVGFSIGSNELGNNAINAGIADFWMDFGTYIDLSIAANRRKFIDANGWPVDLGSDGSRATGSSPDIFLSGDTATWHTNDGTGGGFTENGALTDALSSPGENLGPIDGLVGWWRLDETSGTTINDSSGNSLSGTFNGKPAVPSTGAAIDNGMAFDGENDYITISDDPAFDTITTDITVAIWVNKRTTQSGWRGIFGRPQGAGDDDSWTLFYNPGGNYAFWHHLQGTQASFVPGTNSNADVGQWVHIGVTYDNTTLRFYRNGVEIGNELNAGGDFDNIATDVVIGADLASGGGSYDQWSSVFLDDARVYNRALSATEMAALYDTGMPCKNPDGLRGGTIMYNTTHHVPQYCNNREWRAMGVQPGDGGAGCANPTGEAGDFNYNTTSNVMTYCEGDEWRAVAF